MQYFLSTTPQPPPENKFPDLVYMDLKGISVQSNSNDTKQIDLYLTINFNEQWERLIGGRIKIGLKGGELRLRVENGKIPLASREIIDLIEPNLFEPTDKMGTTTKLNQNRQVNSLLKVTTKGSEENPAWIFEVEVWKSEPVLKGLLKNVKLGTLNVRAKPCHVEATFEVSLRDVYLTDIEGLLPPDISRNKLAVLEREIVLYLLKSKLKPYLSRVQLRYD